MENVGQRFTIKIDRKPIEIRCKYRLIQEQCKEYMTNEVPQIIIQSNALGSVDEVLKGVRVQTRRNERNELVWIDPGIEESMEIQRNIAERMMEDGFLLMHGAAVAKDGEAYIFIAPSGTGKTTRLSFWMELYPDSVIINGDKPMIHIEGSRVLVCGTPWAGKEGWNSNIQVPICAIYLLERNDEDSVKEVSIEEALPMLLKQTYSPSEAENRNKKIKILAAMAGKVHFFHYKSTMSAESVRMAYEAAQAAGPIG